MVSTAMPPTQVRAAVTRVMEKGEGPVTMAAVPCWALQVRLRAPLPTPIRQV